MGSFGWPTARTTAELVAADPALAGLTEALEEASLRNWTLHDVQWVPGAQCRLAWRVPGAGGAGAAYRAGTVQAGSWSSHDYRADPSLPGLVKATDPSVVARHLEPVVGDRLTSCHIQPVRYRPGARCVLRYDVGSPAGGRTFYAKVYARRHFADTAALVTEVASRAGPAGLVVPVTAEWTELDSLLTPAVPGRSMSTVLGDPGVPAVDRLRNAERLGQLLAEFHALDVNSAPARSTADQLDELDQLGRCVTAVDPELGSRYQALLASLRASAPPEAEHRVLAHGGFRTGQAVLDASGTLTLLDLDGVHLGDPARDLATAAAQLVWQATKRPERAEMPLQAEEALLAGYRGHGPTVDPERLRWWRAAAILQVAGRRYRRLETADWELVPALLDRAAVPALDRRSTGGLGVEDDLMDLQRMQRVLAPILHRMAAEPTDVHITSARELARAPGRRRVLEYRVVGLADGDTRLVAKVFDDLRRAELLYRHLRLLSDGPFAAGRWTVPEPVGYLPEHSLVLYRAASGVPISSRQAGAAAVDGVLDAARWLARLHQSQVQLPRHLDEAQEVESTLQWAATLGRLDPVLHQPALMLASRWATVRRPGPAAAAVPLHKDFHPGHVLVDSRVCVVDLDEARLGDPAFDVAHFCAYLDWGSNGADHLRTAFLEEYGRLTGWADDVAFARYSAYTWLKIAKQLATQAGPWRAAGQARGWSPGAALAEGAAWLDR